MVIGAGTFGELSRAVDPHWFRGNSYLKIGWHWIHRALSRGWQLPVSLSLSAVADPEPAIPSRRQADNRHPPYFRATTVDCSGSTIHDADEWIVEYNCDRPHSGRYCYGKTPMETFIDSKHLAMEKMLDQQLEVNSSKTRELFNVS